MKAAVYTRYGGPEEIQIQDVAKPTPGDDEVLIRVYAVSINDWDFQLMLGVPFVNRMLSGYRKPGKTILGSDVAGRIEAVGKKVKDLRVGDEVYGDLSGTWGGFAEYVCALEKNVIRKPKAMSYEEAAALPQAAMLAWQGLKDVGEIEPGQKVLINGAGGGVGTLGVQMAKMFNVEVTGVDRKEKMAMMRAIGFDHVIDYMSEDFTKRDEKYDLILDVKTNRSIFDYTRALKRDGVYVTVGGDMGRLFQALVSGPWASLTMKRSVRICALKANKDLPYMNELFETGRLKPIMEPTYRLEDIREAMTLFGTGLHKGKIVVTI